MKENISKLKGSETPEQKKLLERLPNNDVTYWKDYYSDKLKNATLCDNVRLIYEKKLEIIKLFDDLSNSAEKTPQITETENTTETQEDLTKNLSLDKSLESTEEEPTNPEVEIVTKGQPEHIIIKEIIKNSISDEEEKIIQEQFPNEKIENIIEKEVVEELNNKETQPVKEALSILGKIRKRMKKTFLLLMTVGTFEVISSFSHPRSAEAISYDKIKIENLKDWEKIELDQEAINKLDNISIINKANEKSDEKYLIVDKQKGKTFLYQGDSLIKADNVCLGGSIGDEQTVLKSVYSKVNGWTIDPTDGEKIYNIVDENVSVNEATYLENGERYVKKGYEVFTNWGAGNMKTGAGIYEIANKGPFLDDYGIFLKNERGAQVATSLHVNSHLKEKSPKFRFTNGCVGFSKQDLLELYRTMSLGEKVYILPENPHNKFQIIDGKLRFVSNEKNVNKTIKPYEPQPVVIKAEDANEDSKEFLLTLANCKKDLMKMYPTVSNDVYNQLAKIAYGIMGQESSFGTYGGITGARGQMGRITDRLGEAVGKNVSAGVTQIRISTFKNEKARKFFNINKTKDLFNIKNSAIATMSVLLDIYTESIPNNRKDDYEKLVPLHYNNPAKFKQVIEKKEKVKSSYVKNVLVYSNKVKIYLQNN